MVSSLPTSFFKIHFFTAQNHEKNLPSPSEWSEHFCPESGDTSHSKTSKDMSTCFQTFAKALRIDFSTNDDSVVCYHARFVFVGTFKKAVTILTTKFCVIYSLWIWSWSFPPTNPSGAFKAHKNKLLKNKSEEKMNLYHFRVSSGCLQLLREEHVTRWLKRNIVDQIHFDLSEMLNAATDCISWETPVTAVVVTDN